MPPTQNDLLKENDQSPDVAWRRQWYGRIQSETVLRKWLKQRGASDIPGPSRFNELRHPFGITPHYLDLLLRLGPDHPLWKTVIPHPEEQSIVPGEQDDPLGEETHSPVPGLIHSYPDKVLLLITARCGTYCRYCTRSRFAGHTGATAPNLETVFRYLTAHPTIREVLISGGDPLTLEDAELEPLLARLRAIPHLRSIRIGSKIPAVLPHRITPALCRILEKHGVWLSLHFIHPDELSPETSAACLRLARAGVPMVSQTVLLKGVNDDETILTDLFYSLLEIRVKPYYLLQCDPVTGSARFRTPLRHGIELIQQLQGRVSGLALPAFVVDAPGGSGKTALLDHAQLTPAPGGFQFMAVDGSTRHYPDPQLI